MTRPRNEFSKNRSDEISKELKDNYEEIIQKHEQITRSGYWIISEETDGHYWSKNLFAIFGLDPSMTKPSLDLALSKIHKKDGLILNGAIDYAVKKGVPFQLELRLVNHSREVKYLIIESRFDSKKIGNQPCLILEVKDITSSKKSKKSKINRDVVNLLDWSIDFIFDFETGIICRVSDSFIESLGFSREEIIGKQHNDFVYPPDLEKTKLMIEEVRGGKKTKNFDNRYVDSTGNLVHFNWTVKLRKDTEKVLGLGLDTKELVIFRNNRGKDNLIGNAILNASTDLIWSLDKDFNFLNGNKVFVDLIKGLFDWEIKTGDYLLSDTYFDQEYLAFWGNHYKEAFKGKKVKVESTVQPTKETDTLIFETMVTPIYSKGEIIGLACFSRNITENKNHELSVIELNQKLLRGQELSKTGYWESDLNTNLVFWSEEMYKIWDVTNRDFTIDFDFFFNTIHPNDQKEFLYHRNRALTQEKKLDVIYRIITEKQTIKYIHELGEIITDKNGVKNIFRGTAQEITKEKEYEIKLKERNDFIEAILDNIPLGIAVNKISDGEATYINKAFEDTYGWPQKDLLDVDSFFENIYPDPKYRLWIKNQILEDIQSGDSKRMTWNGILVTTKNGEEKIINAKNIPAPDLNLMISTVTDDTKRYWAEEALRVSNERFKLVSEAVSYAIWDWELEKKSIHWGSGFHRLFGYPADQDQLKAKEWSRYIHPEDFETIVESIQKAKNDKSQKYWTGEYRFKNYDGSYSFVKEKIIMIRNKNGKLVRMIGAIQDINDRKTYEKSLRHLNENLEKANTALEHSNKELEQFAYVASHDLQEPLRMISSFLGLIEKQYNHIIDEKGKKYIHFAVEGARRMRQIILDLLEFSKLDNFQEAKSWVDSAELVHKSQLYLKKNLWSKAPLLHIGDLPKIHGHPSTLIQLFQNIISNAIKYQPAGQQPEIWISAVENTGFWEFAIKDNGIGIEEEYLDKIFVIFQRLHTSDEYTGTGIGLAISKKIVEFHQGRIWVESKFGEGSTVFFSIKKPGF